MKMRAAKFLLSALVSAGMLCYAFSSFDIEAALAAISDAEAIGYGIAFLLVFIAYALRAVRWRIWEKSLSLQESFELIMIGSMVNYLFPARLGEFLRAFCAAHKTVDGYGATAALGSVVVERILDGLTISLIGIMAICLAPVRDLLFYSLLILSSLLGLLAFILLLFVPFHYQIRLFLRRIHGIFPGHLTRFGMEKINFFLDGLILVRSIRKFIFALIFTIMIWGLEMIAYALIARAVWSEFALEKTLVFLSVVNFASLFPFAIGGIGAIEGAAAFYLSNAGVPANYALAMVLIQHGFHFFYIVFMGLIIYFFRGYFDLQKLEKRRVSSSLPEEDIDDAAGPVVSDALLRLKDISNALSLELEPEKRIEISFVIPAYNEQNRLPKTILEILAWSSHYGQDYEILIIDDGSSDDTLKIARLFSRQVANIRFIACPHQGKGAAVKMGMLNADGRYVLFMDADGATPLEEIPKIIEPIQKNADIAIGSRIVQYPDETSVVTSFHRKIIGRTFSGMVNILITPGIGDTQCGFKAFHHRVIESIFSRQKINGFAFDVEILFIARKLGYSIEEIPVNWVNQPGSKVNIITDSIKMLYDVLRIRWNHKNEKWYDEKCKIR